MKIVKKEVMNTVSKYICDVCGQNFDNKSLCERHEKFAHSKIELEIKSGYNGNYPCYVLTVNDDIEFNTESDNVLEKIIEYYGLDSLIESDSSIKKSKIKFQIVFDDSI